MINQDECEANLKKVLRRIVCVREWCGVSELLNVAADMRVAEKELSEAIYFIQSLTKKQQTIRAALQLAQEDEQVKRERDEFIIINISELPSFVYIPLPEGRVIGVNQKIQSIASTGDAYKCAEIIYKSYRAKKVRDENGNA